MNQFETLIGSMNGNRNPYYGTAAQSKPSYPSFNIEYLSKMSEADLERVLEICKKKISMAKSQVERDALMYRIEKIEKELVGRRGEQIISDDVTSTQNQEKTKKIGDGVGSAALIFGVLGFMGAAVMGYKKPLWWAAGGAIVGGVAAFFMSSEAASKIIQPFKNK